MPTSRAGSRSTGIDPQHTVALSMRRAHEAGPASLDLAERAELALNALTRNVDPALRFTPYFDCRLQLDPPVLSHHTYWDHCDGAGRAVDALVLARDMTGCDLGSEIDVHLKKLVSSYQGERGLCWIPEPDFPPRATRRPRPPVAEFWGQRACLMAFVSWYQQSTDAAERAGLRRRIDALIHGLASIVPGCRRLPRHAAGHLRHARQDSYAFAIERCVRDQRDLG